MIWDLFGKKNIPAFFFLQNTLQHANRRTFSFKCCISANTVFALLVFFLIKRNLYRKSLDASSTAAFFTGGWEHTKRSSVAEMGIKAEGGEDEEVSKRSVTGCGFDQMGWYRKNRYFKGSEAASLFFSTYFTSFPFLPSTHPVNPPDCYSFNHSFFLNLIFCRFLMLSLNKSQHLINYDRNYNVFLIFSFSSRSHL